ncbi:MAG: 23S rRNA (adenine(2503)-C(2))-methyltransferase RlmN [Firmicutes bacterium]|nr:23S rRNA (adenine(2503)-C(2))-methyltransferase RlmN [Bacillota bacterium]
MNLLPNLVGMSLEEIEQYLCGLGEQRYRAQQVFEWIYQKGATSFAEMSNLPLALRTRLASEAQLILPRIITTRTSAKADTVKYLLELSDGQRVETVLMRYSLDLARDRKTICVSSQVGCPIGCPFCATGQSGFVRNLSVGEIVGQVLTIKRDELVKTGSSKREPGITNIVFMGMGEPLLNYTALLKSIRLLNHPRGLNIGMRRITVSTAGVVPRIRDLAIENLSITLAVSLHAANDRLRDRLVPLNRKYPLRMLITACREYSEQTGRRVTFEYALINGVNDRPADVADLSCLLKGMLANINVIPINPITGADFVRSTRVRDFVRELNQAGVSAVVREERGTDIEAACGQLRARLEQDPSK